MKALGLSTLILLVALTGTQAQRLYSDSIFAQLTLTADIPEKLLSTRSVAIYDQGFTSDELNEIQHAFSKTGIDAEAYFLINDLFAGIDFSRAIANYFDSRNFNNLVFLQKTKDQYRVYFTAYNKSMDFITPGQSSWHKSNPNLTPLLVEVFQDATAHQKKRNLLINEFPEYAPVKYFPANRNEKFTAAVLSQKVAIPKWGNDTDEAALTAYFDSTGWKYQLVDPLLTNLDLRNEGFRTVLRFAYGQGKVIRPLLGYDKQESSGLSGVTYHAGTPEVKTYKSDHPVYKFYFIHLSYDDLFLGTEWDVDSSRWRALRNHMASLTFHIGK